MENEVREMVQRLRTNAFSKGGPKKLMADAADMLEWLLPSRAAGGGVAPMPPTQDRQPLESREPHGMQESDLDWARENSDAVAWLADNHEAIRRALSASPAPPTAQVGDDALTGCADDQIFGHLPADALRRAADNIASPTAQAQGVTDGAAIDQILQSLDKQTYSDFLHADFDLPHDADLHVTLTAGQIRFLEKFLSTRREG